MAEIDPKHRGIPRPWYVINILNTSLYIAMIDTYQDTRLQQLVKAFRHFLRQASFPLQHCFPANRSQYRDIPSPKQVHALSEQTCLACCSPRSIPLGRGEAPVLLLVRSRLGTMADVPGQRPRRQINRGLAAVFRQSRMLPICFTLLHPVLFLLHLIVVRAGNELVE